MGDQRPEENEARADEGNEADQGSESAGIAYQANVNQVTHEPVPASHHAERHQLAVQRNEEHSAATAASPEESEPEHTGEHGKRPAGRG